MKTRKMDIPFQTEPSLWWGSGDSTAPGGKFCFCKDSAPTQPPALSLVRSQPPSSAAQDIHPVCCSPGQANLHVPLEAEVCCSKLALGGITKQSLNGVRWNRTLYPCVIWANYLITLSSKFFTCETGGVLHQVVPAGYWERVSPREGEVGKQDGAGKSQTRKL